MYFGVMQGHGLPEFCCRNTGEAASRFDSTHIPVRDDVTSQVLRHKSQFWQRALHLHCRHVLAASGDSFWAEHPSRGLTKLAKFCTGQKPPGDLMYTDSRSWSSLANLAQGGEAEGWKPQLDSRPCHSRDSLARSGSKARSAQRCGRSEKPPGSCARLSGGQHSVPAGTRPLLTTNGPSGSRRLRPSLEPRCSAPCGPGGPCSRGAGGERGLRAEPLPGPAGCGQSRPPGPADRAGSLGPQAAGRAGSLGPRAEPAPWARGLRGLLAAGTVRWVRVAVVAVCDQQLCILPGNGTQPCCRIRAEGPALSKGLQSSLPS
ncbi:uncharacterized protein LOC121344448 [Onychostruthus taczanowskii]|uniref:uncharacterized protein LOC121344448 n=1 Tax=Onychostruthus taczanowskii TaxID=356909 RepID=UPI001B80BE46|nr:uncharacterized protein LOC121344448 [Onychostruthus taczanowskii]XP_041276343.1 uncharacterized protein LOC121344448 [Onychostruthus taczanowskii]